MFKATDRSKRAPLTPADLARKVFVTKHNLQLVPSAIEWLGRLVEHFELENEDDITNTFEHLVQGCQGSGSGLGESAFVAI